VRGVKLAFWGSLGLIAYAHAGYPLVLRAMRRGEAGGDSQDAPVGLPRVTLVVAAHDEEDVIERKLDDALSLDYPAELIEVIVASDGSDDRTVELARARAAGDARLTVLDLSGGTGSVPVRRHPAAGPAPPPGASTLTYACAAATFPPALSNLVKL